MKALIVYFFIVIAGIGYLTVKDNDPPIKFFDAKVVNRTDEFIFFKFKNGEVKRFKDSRNVEVNKTYLISIHKDELFTIQFPIHHE